VNQQQQEATAAAAAVARKHKVSPPQSKRSKLGFDKDSIPGAVQHCVKEVAKKAAAAKAAAAAEAAAELAADTTAALGAAFPAAQQQPIPAVQPKRRLTIKQIKGLPPKAQPAAVPAEPQPAARPVKRKSPEPEPDSEQQEDHLLSSSDDPFEPLAEQQEPEQQEAVPYNPSEVGGLASPRRSPSYHSSSSSSSSSSGTSSSSSDNSTSSSSGTSNTSRSRTHTSEVLDYEGADEEVATAAVAAATVPAVRTVQASAAAAAAATTPVPRVKSSAPKAALAGRVRKPAAATAPSPRAARSTAAKAAKSKITAALKAIAAAESAPAASGSIDSDRLFALTDWAESFGLQKEQLEALQQQHRSTRQQLKREKEARAAATAHFQQQAENVLRSTEDRLNAQQLHHSREVANLRTQLHAANVQYGELVRRGHKVIVENPDGTESIFGKFFWYPDTPDDQFQHFRQWEHPHYRGLFDVLFTQAAVDSRLAF
jgi:hypothetical protein